LLPGSRGGCPARRKSTQRATAAPVDGQSAGARLSADELAPARRTALQASKEAALAALPAARHDRACRRARLLALGISTTDLSPRALRQATDADARAALRTARALASRARGTLDQDPQVAHARGVELACVSHLAQSASLSSLAGAGRSTSDRRSSSSVRAERR